VPFTSFCEYANTKPKKMPTWFAFSKERPLAAFADIWTTWHGTLGTKAKPVEGEHEQFGFLTTEANNIVGAIHFMAMPVILTTKVGIEMWITAPAEDALKLPRRLPDGKLKIVAAGERKDVAAKTRSYNFIVIEMKEAASEAASNSLLGSFRSKRYFSSTGNAKVNAPKAQPEKIAIPSL
jgi:putative SOS response-associated peptidase YedK